MTSSPDNAAISWRPMHRDDLEVVVRIADLIHPELPEPPEVFENRLDLWPSGALVLCDGARVTGYALGHPIRFPEPPALGAVMAHLAPDADAFYVHDVAILPQMRGRSLAGAALERLLDSASGLSRACLIAVYGTPVFWRRHGFEEAVNVLPAEKLAGFGENAQFMIREL